MKPKLRISKKQGINHFVLAVIITAGTALLCTPLVNTQSYHVVSFILLFVVSILATFMGTGPVLLASTLSAIFWNFFFIPPQFTFHIEKTEDILIFGLFFIIALVNGVLTTRVRKQEQLVRDREKRTNALFQLTKELSKASGIDEVLTVAIREIKTNFQIDSFFILQNGENRLNDVGRVQKGKKILTAEYHVAEWVFNHAQKAGAFTPNTMGTDFTIFPLSGTRISPGVVVAKLDRDFSGDQKAYWDTFLVQISNALEREFLGEMAQRVRFLDESDRLYKTLFNSISHELRIPVATIMGASDSMLNVENSENTQQALSNEIFTASLRLNRLIENLLNISRLESGHISARLDWYDINDLVNKVADDLKDEMKPFTLVVDIQDEMPFVKIDFGLMEQVLYNLLLNATQHAPPASEIVLFTGYSEGVLVIKVTDKGPGFPENEIKNVFKKFFRVDSNKTGGLGLGLSIAKGFVEAHNGTISVENVKKKGAGFTIQIPTEIPDMKNLQEQDEKRR